MGVRPDGVRCPVRAGPACLALPTLPLAACTSKLCMHARTAGATVEPPHSKQWNSLTTKGLGPAHFACLRINQSVFVFVSISLSLSLYQSVCLCLRINQSVFVFVSISLFWGQRNLHVFASISLVLGPAQLACLCINESALERIQQGIF